MITSEIHPLSQKTRASLQAALVAISLDDVCAIMLRHALRALETESHARKLSLSITVDYESWSLTVKHNAISCPDVDNKEIEMLSYLGMLHSRTCAGRKDTTRIIENCQVVFSDHTPKASLQDQLSGPMRMLEERAGAVTCLRDIFRSLPVRRRFLSSASNRKKQNDSLIDTVKRLSLLNTCVSFRLLVLPSGSREPKTLLALSSVLNLSERCRQVYGPESVDKIFVQSFTADTAVSASGDNFSTEDEAARLQLQGFVSLEVASKPLQIVLVNGYSWADLQSARHTHTSAFENEDITSYLGLLEEARRLDLLSLIENRIGCITGAANSSKGLQHAFVIIATLETLPDSAKGPIRQNTQSFKAAILNSVYNLSAPTSAYHKCSEADSIDGISETSLTVASVKCVSVKRPKTAPTASSNSVLISPKRPQTATLEVTQRKCHEVQPPAGMTTWHEPGTERLFFIDTQTGQSFGPIDRQANVGESNRGNAKRGMVDRSNLRKQHADGDGRCVADWLDSALEGWQNPAFGGGVSAMLPARRRSDEFDDAELDEALASLPSTPRRSKRMALAPHRSSRFFKTDMGSTTALDPENINASIGVNQTAIHPAGELPLSRVDLATAQVLSQVDEKFVLCTMTPNGKESPVLVCFDQHAVDERYRLEQLLQDYVRSCHSTETATTTGEAPITISINRQEYQLLADRDRNSAGTAVRASLAFLRFSVAEVVLIHEGFGHAQVDLTSIPDILRDRVVSVTGRIQNADLLATVFRATLAELFAHPIPASVLEQGQTDVINPSSWLAATRHIPPSLMDLFCSKACRSAIMFNDPLSKSACEALISRLSLCRFPFQCAHGRPTLVPLCRY